MEVMNDYAAKKAMEAVIVNALRAANPNLVPAGHFSSVVIAAKNIRIELKAVFPGVKFRVNSKSYAGGNSINVNYVDGPARKRVDEIVNKYEYGNFNGMEDIYEYNDDMYFNDAFGGAKYIFADRVMSEELMAAALAAFVEKYGKYEDMPSLEDYKNGNAYNFSARYLLNEFMAGFEL